MISMYGPMMYSSMYGSMCAGNSMQYFQQRYGCGPEDFSTRPYVQPYPVAYSPIAKPAPVGQTLLGKFLHKIFG